MAVPDRREVLDRTAVLDDSERVGVGRPDVRDAFDGGLIDANNAPPEVIARLPAVSKELARGIVALREEIGSFGRAGGRSSARAGRGRALPAATGVQRGPLPAGPFASQRREAQLGTTAMFPALRTLVMS